MTQRRVVITGFGVVTPLGSDYPSLWSALKAGRSGLRDVSPELAGRVPTRVVATVSDFSLDGIVDRKQARHLDRSTAMAIYASDAAVADAGLDVASDPESVGVWIGTGVGCLGVVEEQARVYSEGGARRVSPFLAAMMLPSMAAAQVAIQIGARGPVRGISTACATGADNIAAGLEAIRAGSVRAAIAGGTDAAITALGLSAFANSRSLYRGDLPPEKASRPFDLRRDGFVMGEGAGIVVLESLDSARERGATIHAEILGHGATCDSHHITAPREDGSGLASAIRLALKASGVSPEDVGYVNAHGTSTPLNDRVETLALKTALGQHAPRIPISSTKSMIGHLLGAAGAVEAIVTALSLEEGYVHPTINLDEPDPDCDLDYVPNVGREVSIDLALSTSLAFGGHNAALVFRRWP